eukprot:12851919-Alexandrium_andersonii.AAC.1
MCVSSSGSSGSGRGPAARFCARWRRPGRRRAHCCLRFGLGFAGSTLLANLLRRRRGSLPVFSPCCVAVAKSVGACRCPLAAPGQAFRFPSPCSPSSVFLGVFRRSVPPLISTSKRPVGGSGHMLR